VRALRGANGESRGGAAYVARVQPLCIPGAFMWSRRQPDRRMNFNSFFFSTPEGNVAVDPLPLETDELEQLVALSGLSWVVLTNRDHVRSAAVLRESFGARIATSEAEASAIDIPVDRVLHDGDTAFPGAVVVALQHQKTPGEFALHLAEHSALVVGDALIGVPAGALSLLPDERYADVTQSVLALRRLWALKPEVLLLGDGTPLFSGATRAIGAVLFARGGLAVNRINLDDVPREHFISPDGKFGSDDADVDPLIGGEHLGYQVVTLKPGMRFCPLHAHYREEELYIVLEGTPSVRTDRETLQCRAGDFIAFPVGREHAHQLLNESAADATVILLGAEQPEELVYYPDSDKISARAPGVRYRLRAKPQLEYFDSE
jgi:uncharacterized cupin superfamily protein/glyoxylase-like metal-dependent hydrolase (beta-lactamase superfamily II)